MLVYEDIFSGDKLLSDSFPHVEILHGILWEVEGKWVVNGALKVDNPSAEGGDDDDDDEGVDGQEKHDDDEVIDIVDTFKLKEQPSMDRAQFMTYMKKIIMNLTPMLKEEDDELKLRFFTKRIIEAIQFLRSKLNDLQFFVGESMHDDAVMVFAYYKDGADDPTFLYLPHFLKEIEC